MAAISLVPIAGAATYVMPNGSNYFANHLFSTYTGAVVVSVTTGQLSPARSFAVTQAGLGVGAGSLSNTTPKTLPTGSGFPATMPLTNEIDIAALSPLGTGIIRYTFNAALPAGTHVYVQDLDTGESATLRFYDCAGALINPSGFDFLQVSTNGPPTPSFSANNVTLTGTVAANDPLEAIIIRDPNVCRIDYSGVVGGGSFKTYFSLPPTDLSLAKSLATPNPVIPGGSVSWTLTLTNTSPATGIAGLANPSAAIGVSVTDTVNVGVTGLTASITNAGGTTGGSCTVSAGNAVSCTGFSPLANGQSITITLSGSLAADYSGASLANTANGTDTAPIDPNTANNTSTSTTPVARPITLAKTWSGATAGHAVNLSISGGADVTNSVAGSSTAPATTTEATAMVAGTGAVVTLAEIFTNGAASFYATTLTCMKTTDSGNVTVNGSGLSRTITMPSDSAVTCSYANTHVPTVDLSITKTNTPAFGALDQANDTVVSGSTIIYTIIITNGGPDAVANAVFRDPVPTGVVMTAVSCSAATGGAVCPAPASVTVANMQSGGGIAIPSIPSGGSATFTVTGTVQ